ncbi:MAG: DUF4838 domain-containing protein [Clostridia bacterium]|nr:DUF4838 domain-containing protein [Clostridia bacterium]
MKKFFIKFISVVLALSFILSATACKPTEQGGSSVSQIFDSGVHQLNYTQTSEYVVKNSRSDYVIVVSNNTDNIEKLAVDELNLLFEEATGVNLSVVQDNELTFDEQKKVICLGDNSYYQQALAVSQNLSVKDKDLGHSGYVIETLGNGIYIVGNSTYSTLYGVYGFLEIEFGFDCYSNTGYYIEKNVTTLALKDYSVIDVPDFKFRSCYYTHITQNDPTKYRMKFGEDNDFIIGEAGKHNGAHTGFLFLPKEEYFETNREWFSVDGTQLCYTARGDAEDLELMQKAVFESMKELFIKYSDRFYIKFGHADSNTWCNCDACTKAKTDYGTDSAVVILFANKLVKLIDEWMETPEGTPYKRDYKILLLAYGMTLIPPTVKNKNGEWTAVAPEVICDKKVSPWYAPIEMDYNLSLYAEENKMYLDALNGWDAISDTMSYYTYSTNYKNFLVPIDFYDQLQGFYQTAAKSNAYFFVDLGQRKQASGVTGWHVLKSYLISKLSWNVNYDVSTLTDNFFEGYFGPASKDMRKYYDSYRVQSKYNTDNYFGDVHAVFMIMLDAKYWPKYMLDRWYKNVEDALKSIEFLKRVDMAKYNTYYDHITMERVALCYLMVELYQSNYAKEFIDKIKLDFKNDCNRLGISVSAEGNSPVDAIYSRWGV